MRTTYRPISTACWASRRGWRCCAPRCSTSPAESRDVTSRPESIALRGAALTFVDDPASVGVEAAMRYEADAIVAMANGHITHVGPASQVMAQLPPGTPVQSNGRDSL